MGIQVPEPWRRVEIVVIEVKRKVSGVRMVGCEGGFGIKERGLGPGGQRWWVVY